MRSQSQLPEDPQTNFMDFVGNQRSPLWDEMEMMEDECTRLKEDIEALKKQADELTVQKEEAVRLTAIKECYDAADPEKTNALTMKPLVAKLSGLTKFEVDHKLTKDQFADIILKIVGTGDKFDAEKYEKTLDAL